MGGHDLQEVGRLGSTGHRSQGKNRERIGRTSEGVDSETPGGLVGRWMSIWFDLPTEARTNLLISSWNGRDGTRRT